MPSARQHSSKRQSQCAAGTDKLVEQVFSQPHLLKRIVHWHMTLGQAPDSNAKAWRSVVLVCRRFRDAGYLPTVRHRARRLVFCKEISIKLSTEKDYGCACAFIDNASTPRLTVRHTALQTARGAQHRACDAEGRLIYEAAPAAIGSSALELRLCLSNAQYVVVCVTRPPTQGCTWGRSFLLTPKVLHKLPEMLADE